MNNDYVLRLDYNLKLKIAYLDDQKKMKPLPFKDTIYNERSVGPASHF